MAERTRHTLAGHIDEVPNRSEVLMYEKVWIDDRKGRHIEMIKLIGRYLIRSNPPNTYDISVFCLRKPKSQTIC